MALANALPTLIADLQRIATELEGGQGTVTISQKVPEVASAIMTFVLQAQVTPGQLVTGTSAVGGPVAGATTTLGTLV